jgi:ubiquinone biosynthesis protein Coq4
VAQDDAQAVQRIEQELQQLNAVLVELTGLPSRWNGEVFLLPMRARGVKPYECSIQLRRDLAYSEERWRTLIHELLHACSVGCLPEDFRDYRGWEEGVVEQLQRILRVQVLARIGVQVDEIVFQQIESGHPFNIYITALESIREVLGETEASAFYIALLATPLARRYQSLFESAMRLQPERRAAAILALSVNKERLRKAIL